MNAFRKPSIWAWLLLAAGLALFVSAGRWQYGKAQLKYLQQSQWAESLKIAAVPLSQALQGDTDTFDRISVYGTFLRRVYLLDNQIRDGRSGIEVFVPFRSEDGPLMLAALGWLPYADARRTLPTIDAVPAGDVALTGMLVPPPAHGLRIGRAWPEQTTYAQAMWAETNYPKLMPYFALDEIEADLDQGKLVPRVLRIDAESGSPYRRDWRPAAGMPPARHLAYAWQWWSLAAAIIIVFLVVHRRRDAPP